MMRFPAFLLLLLCVSLETPRAQVIPADARMEAYLPLLSGKRIGVVCNHTAMVDRPGGGTLHLVDTLLRSGIDVAAAFGPEHGFRGDLPDGAHAPDGSDPDTGIPVHSLYGTNKKPTAEQLRGLDAVVFDIQDVGVRCYTYLSTLILVMEACAEQGLPLIVLDRPNPNGHLIDGPMLHPADVRSFVGFLPIPLVHGMTLGELAEMANGEGWLGGGYKGSPDPSLRCDLTVIPCSGWGRLTRWSCPIAPSPNLPTPEAVRLYPHLVLLEATTISIGRGTEAPFTQVGFPGFIRGPLAFTPQPNAASQYPKHAGERCTGFSVLRRLAEWEARGDADRLHLEIMAELLEAWQATPTGDHSPFIDRPAFFDQLAGGPDLRREFLAGTPLREIGHRWAAERRTFMESRSRYLRYPDGP